MKLIQNNIKLFIDGEGDFALGSVGKVGYIIKASDKEYIGAVFDCIDSNLDYDDFCDGKITNKKTKVKIKKGLYLTKDNILVFKYDRMSERIAINLIDKTIYIITKKEKKEYLKNLSDRKYIIIKNSDI
jgi:hypothetical protein